MASSLAKVVTAAHFCLNQSGSCHWRNAVKDNQQRLRYSSYLALQSVSNLPGGGRAVSSMASSPAVLPAWGVPSRLRWASRLLCSAPLLTSAASSLAGCPGMTLEPSAPTGLICICSAASCPGRITEVPATENSVRHELICSAAPWWLRSQARRRRKMWSTSERRPLQGHTLTQEC